ncbi:MAG: hypothetical protein M0R68_10565 [Bacteroidetes bacterium]|nr:hypothetical protein [Bacteroidota bacterium]
MVRLLCFGLVVFSVCVQAQLMTGRLTTSVYGYEGRDSALAAVMMLRAYENVYVNAASENYSFNMNAMVSNDFGTTIETDPELRVNSFLMKVKNIGGIADITAGRQFVFAGVGSGLIDGLSGTARFMDRTLSVTGYGGANVIQSRAIRKSYIGANGLFGGQVTYVPSEEALVGISYMNKRWQRKPYTALRMDSLYFPYAVVINSRPNEEELASVDVEYQIERTLTFQAKTDFDFHSDEISKVQTFARYSLLKELNVTAEYIYRQPRVAYNSIFSVFNINSTKEIEGGVEYRPITSAFVYARFANVSYVDETSQRLVIGGTYDIFSANYTQNFGYAGELNGISVQAVYPMLERTFTPMLAFGYATYKLTENDAARDVINGTAGVVYRPVQKLSTDLQVQWMSNPQYNTDLRIFLKVNYWFSEQMNWL